MNPATARVELSNLRDYLRSSLERDRDAAIALDIELDDAEMPAWRREFYYNVALKHRVTADRKERQADAIEIALAYLPKFEMETV